MECRGFRPDTEKNHRGIGNGRGQGRYSNAYFDFNVAYMQQRMCLSRCIKSPRFKSIRSIPSGEHANHRYFLSPTISQWEIPLINGFDCIAIIVASSVTVRRIIESVEREVLIQLLAKVRSFLPGFAHDITCLLHQIVTAFPDYSLNCSGNCPRDTEMSQNKPISTPVVDC